MRRVLVLSVVGVMCSLGVSGWASATNVGGTLAPPTVLGSFMSGGVNHVYEFDTGAFTSGPLAGATFEEWGLASVSSQVSGPLLHGKKQTVSNDGIANIFAVGEGTLQGDGVCGIQSVNFWFTAQSDGIIGTGTMKLGVPFQGNTITIWQNGSTFSYSTNLRCSTD